MPRTRPRSNAKPRRSWPLRATLALKKEAEARKGFAARTYAAGTAAYVENGGSAPKAALQFGLSERTVRRGITILKHGTAAQIASAENGESSMTSMADEVTAMIFPDPEKGGRGKRSQNREGLFGDEAGKTTANRLSQARKVLAFSRKIALAVRDGTKTLDEALAQVDTERKSMESDEAKLARLIAEAPDLAELVREERLKLVAGLTEHNELPSIVPAPVVRRLTCPQSAPPRV